jgi:hypothetical protein
MPSKTAIDYFQTYQVAKEPQRSGVSVTPGGDRSRCLYFHSDGSLAQKPFDTSGHSAFYLRVDEHGRAQFGAPLLKTEGSKVEWTFLVLTLDKDRKLSAAQSTDLTEIKEGCRLLLMSSVDEVSKIPKGEKSRVIVAAVKNVLHFRIFDRDGNMLVDTNETELTTQAGPIKDLREQLKGLWSRHQLTESEEARVISAATSIVGHTSAPGYLKSANFKLYNEYWANNGEKKKLYLSTDGLNKWTVNSEGTVLQVLMEVTKPQELKMSNITWYSDDHDLQRTPALTVPGSTPRIWSLVPDLPQGLKFLTDTGAVIMEKGKDVSPATKKEYKLTVENAYGSAETKFSIEVIHITKPQGLTMSNITWYTNDHDLQQTPALSVPGSTPCTWSLVPDLPQGLKFLADTGAVIMEKGRDVPPAAKKEYKLTAENAKGSAETKFSIEIRGYKAE